MRKVITILLLLISSLVGATDYYVSNTGNNSNTGLSDVQAWATIAKVNTVWNAGTFVPGDRVLFKRNGTFYGTIEVKESGTSGSPITIGAYGTGADPILSGFTNITTGWSDMDNGIFNLNFTAESTPNMLLFDGVNTPLGRYPDATYLTVEGASNTSLTDNTLPANPNFTGGEVVVRTWYWIMEKATISSHVGTRINHPSMRYTPKSGYGYFIQNHYDCLTAYKEWSWLSDYLYVYFGAENPYSHVIKVSSLDHVIECENYSYITIEGVTIEGGNTANIYLLNADHITVNDCTVRFSGGDGIYADTNSEYLSAGNSVFNENNNTGLNLNYGPNHTISYNYINKSGYYPGMGESSDQDYSGIISRGNYNLITHNDILHSGYDGIAWGGTDSEVSYNFIDYVCTVKDDGGGIYCYRDYNSGKVVKYNIVLHSEGADAAIGEGNDRANGIYNDGAYLVEYTHNVVAHCHGGGMFANAAHDLTITYNTLFDNDNQLFVLSEATSIGHASGHAIDHNIFFANTWNYDWIQTAFRAVFIGLAYHDYGVQNYNYFVRPIFDNDYIDIWPSAWQWNPDPRLKYNLTEWRAYSGEDANSASTPVTVTTLNNIHFIYNDSLGTKNFALSQGMVDGTNTAYSGTITLQPYTSLVLIGAGTVYETGGTATYVPTVITNTVTVDGVTATAGGNVTNSGGAPVTARGVCYALTINPTTANSHTSNGTGTGNFVSTITGLPSTTYHVRAYATNSVGTGYGVDRVFTTGTVATVIDKLLILGNRFIILNGRLLKL